MTAKIPLTLACGDYELTAALIDGRAEPDGIELTVLTDDSSRIYSRGRAAACDLAEFNVTEYVRAREHGHDVIGLPVFPHRRFRHGYIFVNTQAGIHGPQDLAGRTVAIAGAAPAAAVWCRGILEDIHGLDSDTVHWIENPLPDLDSDRLPEPEVNEETLLSGRAHALISPGVPAAFIRRDPRIARLFPDYKQRDIAYFETTRIFPIMHLVTVSKSLVAEHPWIAASMIKAFEEAKRLAYHRVSNPRVTPLAFFEHAWEEQRDLLGADPWAYGLDDRNRATLETIVRYCVRQRRISQPLPLSDLVLDANHELAAR